MQQRDEYKAKELQFDELAGIKLQLDSEIELYRNILNEAEQSCGYISPLNPVNTATHNQYVVANVYCVIASNVEFIATKTNITL